MVTTTSTQQHISHVLRTNTSGIEHADYERNALSANDQRDSESVDRLLSTLTFRQSLFSTGNR